MTTTPIALRPTARLLFAACIAVALPAARAQAPAPAAASAAKPLAFDAISIKPAQSGAQMDAKGGMMFRAMMRNLPDGFSSSNITAKMLIANAYDIKEDQITGGPSWVGSAGYDVEAKVTDPDGPHQLTKEQRSEMLRSLLADRFQLAAHTDTREGSILALTLAKGGPKLKESSPNAALKEPKDIPPGAVIGGPGGQAGGAAGAQVGGGPGGLPPGAMISMRPGQIFGRSMTMARFVDLLSRLLHATVVDKTGLSGQYDITLQWTPDEASGAPRPGPDGGRPGPNSGGPGPQLADPSGPTIFTALQEQLGLKLDSTKGPVKTLVIDHIEKPSEN